MRAIVIDPVVSGIYIGRPDGVFSLQLQDSPVRGIVSGVVEQRSVE
jgi:hypothetical protein